MERSCAMESYDQFASPATLDVDDQELADAVARALAGEKQCDFCLEWSRDYILEVNGFNRTMCFACHVAVVDANLSVYPSEDVVLLNTWWRNDG